MIETTQFTHPITTTNATSLAAKPKEVARYVYKNKDGKPICWKIRYEPGFYGKSKSFKWQRHSENGKIIDNRDGCENPLYRLPEVLSGIETDRNIFLVEGEKDVETLMKLRLIATTTSETSEWNDGFTQILSNAKVVILYDNDKTGLERRDRLCGILYGRVKSLRVVDLPGLEYCKKHGLDVTDWLNMGNTVEQLKNLVQQAPEYEPPQDEDALRVIYT